MQGDNIYDSRDSRQFGPVPYGLIQGRAFLRVRISFLFVVYLPIVHFLLQCNGDELGGKLRLSN